MKRQFYDFLFNLRASGFFHNTPENAGQTAYAYIQSESNSLWAGLDGEVGSLSDSNLTDLRNLAIGIAFLAARELSDANFDSEYVYAISDYHTNQIQEINSVAGYKVFIDDMIRNYRQVILDKSRNSYEKRINKCIHYIDQKLYTLLRVQDVADHMNMSPSYLTNLFRKKTGQRLYAYIQARKIDEAKTIMDNTSISITEVASALGYHSLSHFSKAFKATTGLSPQTYRNR